jgi:hypothetical protein
MRTFQEFVAQKDEELANEMMAMDAPPQAGMQHGAPTAYVQQNTDPKSGVLANATPDEQEMYNSLKTPQERLEFIKHLKEKRGHSQQDMASMAKRLGQMAKQKGYFGGNPSKSIDPNDPYGAAQYFADKYGN